MLIATVDLPTPHFALETNIVFLVPVMGALVNFFGASFSFIVLMDRVRASRKTKSLGEDEVRLCVIESSTSVAKCLSDSLVKPETIIINFSLKWLANLPNPPLCLISMVFHVPCSIQKLGFSERSQSSQILLKIVTW